MSFQVCHYSRSYYWPYSKQDPCLQTIDIMHTQGVPRNPFFSSIITATSQQICYTYIIMKQTIEKVGLLSLSLILTSSAAIAPAIPAMKAFYHQFSDTQVELILSIPSLFVILTLLANHAIRRVLSEQHIIIISLILIPLAGVVPFFVQEYWLVLASRAAFGVGTGLINAVAITILSDYYTGRERAQVLGWRVSAEIIGCALLTLLAGQLIKISWMHAFLIYTAGLIILAIFLICAPRQPQVPTEPTKAEGASPTVHSLSRQQLSTVIGLTLCGVWFVCIDVSLALRLPEITIAAGFGSATDASIILSLKQIMGIIAGAVFVYAVSRYKQRLLALSALLIGVVLLGLSLSPTIWLLGLSSFGVGFVYSIILSTIFHRLSDEVPAQSRSTATAIVLVGCNLGGGSAPYALQLFSWVGARGLAVFAWFGVLSMLIGASLWFFHQYARSR